jgi:hypothetical protein
LRTVVAELLKLVQGGTTEEPVVRRSTTKTHVATRSAPSVKPSKKQQIPLEEPTKGSEDFSDFNIAA